MVTACAKHGCQLIDECCGCQAPLTLLENGYGGCLCGASYGEAKTVQATAFEIEVARTIASLSSQLAGVHLGVDEGPHTVRRGWFLCANMTRARTGKEGKATCPKTVAEARERLTRVAPLLLDWPRAFDGHVVQRWNAPGADGLTAAMRLGSWYRGLLKQKGALAEALLSRCLFIVGTMCGDAYKTNRHQDGSTWVSAVQGGEILGIRSERIVEAVRDGTMDGAQGRSGTGHLQTIVSIQDVGKVRELRARFATELSEEANFFGEGCRTPPHPCVDGDFDLEQIREAVDRVRQGAREECAGSDGIVSFRKVNLRRTADRVAILKIYRLIADQELRPLKFDGASSLGDAQFSEAEPAVLLQQHSGARAWAAS